MAGSCSHAAIGVWESGAKSNLTCRGGAENSFVYEALWSSPNRGLYLDSFEVPLDGTFPSSWGRKPRAENGPTSILRIALQVTLYVLSKGADIESRAASARYRRE